MQTVVNQVSTCGVRSYFCLAHEVTFLFFSFRNYRNHILWGVFRNFVNFLFVAITYCIALVFSIVYYNTIFGIRLCSVTRIFENPPGFPEDFWITILRICPKILQSVRLADENFFLTSYCIYQYKFFFLYSSSLRQLPFHQR